MPRFKDFEPRGVIPATLMAFNDDLSIDEKSTRKHLRDVANVAGITAVAINAHASEVHACTVDEQRRVLEFTIEEIGDEARPLWPPNSPHGPCLAWSEKIVAVAAWSQSFQSRRTPKPPRNLPAPSESFQSS